MKRIVVAEYPKSGGTWLVSLIGNALSLPKRDIYVTDDFKAFDVANHPWYAGESSWNLTDDCVIKSHEMPDSPLHGFTAGFVHLIRDGRDVAVSKYFFEKDFCVKNGIYAEFTTPFDEYVDIVSREWAAFIEAWLHEPRAVICTYEDLLRDPFSSLSRTLALLGEAADPGNVRASVMAHTKEKMKRSLDRFARHNTFVRKGTAGDWRNHFSERHKDVFKKNAGDALIRLRYEETHNW